MRTLILEDFEKFFSQGSHLKGLKIKSAMETLIPHPDQCIAIRLHIHVAEKTPSGEQGRPYQAALSP